MFFSFRQWLRRMWHPRRTPSYKKRSPARLAFDCLEDRTVPALQTFPPGAYLIDMGQATQTVANALKPYGLVYDMVTNYKVPVDWAINPAKTTYRLDGADPVPVDFTATITTGTKSYSGGSFIIDAGFLTPAVVAEINTWKAQGVVVDKLAVPLTTDIYGQITSFPRAVLDLQNGAIAQPYYANAGIPASSYQLGNPTNLDHCDDVYIMPHADPQTWSDAWKQALYDFVNAGGGLWAGCHSVSALEALTMTSGGQRLNFLSNDLVPWGSHSAGTPPYTYNPAAANDPIMQIMNRLDAATQNGSEQIYVPTTLDWRSTTTVAVYDPDHPNNPLDGTSPYNDAAVVAYGNAFGDPTKGLVMYEAGHSLAKASGAANIAAQRAFFNFLLTEGINKAPQASVSMPTIVAGQAATITATISGGSGTYSYQWVSSNGGVFSNPAGTWNLGDPAITTQYLMTGAQDTVRLVITDTPCGRQGLYSTNLADAPPTLDLDANNSSGATGADYKGYFLGGGAVVPAADLDVLVTDNGTTIYSGAIKLTTRPDGAAESLLIDQSLAASYGISVTSDGAGGFVLSGAANLVQYQAVIASLQYVNSLPFPSSSERVITATVNDGISDSNTAVSRLTYLGANVTTVTKNLYLNDPNQGLDRIDPVATGDASTAQTIQITGPQTVTQTVIASDPFALNNYASGSGWLSGWTEVGETTNPAAGNIQVVTDLGDPSLRLTGNPTTGAPFGAFRAVNLTGSAQALLTFDYRRANLDDATDKMLVQISTDGTTWTTVHEIAGPTNDNIYRSSPIINITPYISANTRIRFLTSGLTNANDFIYIDDVNVTRVSGGGTPAYQWVADNFDPAGGYAGNDGTSSWVNSWTETGDDNSATTGAFRTVTPVAPNTGFALQIAPDTRAGFLAAVGDNIARQVNLSGVGQATLKYDFREIAGGNGTIQVQVAPDGVTWTTLATYNQNSGSGFASFDISTYSTANTQIRFRVATTDNNDALYYFDNVRVEYVQGVQSTTLTPALDTWINQATTTTQTYNYGGSTTLSVDREDGKEERSLLQFDLAALPANAVITSAQLVMTKIGGNNGIQNIDVFGLSSAWSEGNLNGAAGAANWTQRQTGVNWATAGGDFTGTSIATQVVSVNGSYTWDVTKLLSDWVDGARSNFGFLVYSPDTGGGRNQTFASSENLTAANRPKLILRYATYSTGITSVTFTQNPTMVAPFIMPAGEAVTATSYIQVTGGTFVNPPNIDALLSVGGTNFAALTGAPVVTATTDPNIFRLQWTGTFANTTIMAPGEAVQLELRSNEPGFTFRVLYDSQTYPSQISLDTATAIQIDTLGLYDAGYPAGSPVATTEAGQPAYVRFTVSDPFGASDITGADLLIKNSLGGTVLSTSLTEANVVASTAGTKTYEYAWTPLSGDTFTITVTAHEGTEGVTGTGQTTITTTAAPDLVITKSDGGATVNAGGLVTYTLNYSNVGLGNATGVIITEFLPPGASFDAAGSTPGWTAVGSSEYHFAVGSLAAGASGSVTFAVTVPSPVAATLEQLDNAAQIADDGTHGADSTPANNFAADSTPVNAAPDLVITKTDGDTSTLPGGIVLYQISYSNIGTQNANGVVILENLPANTTFNSTYSVGAWDDEGGGVYSLLIGNLPVGVIGTVTFAVTVNSPLPGGVTQISNTASISDGGAGGSDLNPANNTATDTTPISNNPQADLQITKTDGLTSVQPGSTVTYTITITNAGPNTVTGATFTDAVPAALSGVIYTTAISGGAAVSSPSGIGNSVSGLLDQPMGSTVIYTITGTLDPNATGTLTNVASVLPPAGILDPNTGNNTAVDEDPIVPVSDLSLNKSFTYTDLDGSGTLTPGDQIVFTLTVSNSGPNAAQNVSVHDLLPNGYLYVSDDAAVNGGTYSVGTGLWTIGTIGASAPNNTAVLHITATVYAAGTYTNVAEVWTSDSFDPDSTPQNFVPTEDDYQSVTPPVQPVSDLSLSKTMTLTSDLDSNGILSIGDRVTFTLTLNNAGPSAAANVHVADLLPAGYSFFSYTATAGTTYTSGTGDWNVGTVNVLSPTTLNIVATVVGGRPASAYTNYAQVSASGSFDPDSTPNNNSTTEDDNASVAPLIADLSVTKTVAFAPGGDLDANGTPSTGDQIVFTLTLSNAGPDYATGVQLKDQLPSGYTYDDDDGVGAYNPVTGIWTVGVVAPGTTRTLNITATILATGSFTNTAQVTASQYFDPDSTPNNNVASEDDQATVTLNPGATSVAPVAVNDSSLHNAPGAVTLNVTNNDTDANLDLNVASVDLNPSVPGQQTTFAVAGQGTWTVDSLGNVTFTPLAGFTHDPTPIPYVVQDATGKTSLNQATITIDYVPVATNDSSSGHTTGTAVTVPVLTNDTTGDTAVPSTVQIVGTPAPGISLVVAGEGTWSVNTTTGAITFTPQAGFTGDPTPIQYTVKDAQGNTSNAATVTLDYNQFPPVAVNDNSLTNQPGPVTLNVTGNDTDPNNDVDPSTVDLDLSTPGQQTLRTVLGQGYWAVNSAGNVTFNPEVGFTLDPTPITYTVQDRTGLTSNVATITVGYVPVATNDNSSGNPTGSAVTVNVLANDTTGDSAVAATVRIVGTANPGDPLVVPGQGTWSVNTTTGAITFTPAPGYTGDPTPVQYTVKDAQGNTSNAATVTVDYTQYPPVAVNDSSLHNLPGPVSLNVTTNDTDANGDLLSSTVDLDPATAGQQTTLTVSGEGTWTVNGSGSVTFTPQSGFTHDPTPIPYTVSDAIGLVSNQATITIDYVPVAGNDSSTGNTTGTPVTVNVLANDTTGDAVVPSTLKIFGTANPGESLVVPGQGTWSVNTTTGEITFTPEAGYTGDPTPIQYTVQDNDGNTSAPATVTVDYNQFPPAAVNDSSLHNPAGPVTLNVTGNDSDANGDLRVNTVDLDPATLGQQATLVVGGQGTWEVDGLGKVTFTPSFGFTQDPTPIPYTVSDATGLVSNQATITIDYVPVGVNDFVSGSVVGTPVTVPVLANDTTGDAGVPFTVQIVGTTNPGDSLVVPGQGTWSVNTTTGAITFTPEAGFTSDPSPIQYTVKDNDGNTSAPATVTVDYEQHPPVAVNDSDLHNLPGPVTVNVTANDTDPNADLVASTVDLDPSTAGQQTTRTVTGEGTWTVDGSGNVTFTPFSGFTLDPTSIAYTVSDSTGQVSNQATITIDYAPVATNDILSGNPTGTAATVLVLANDITGDAVVPSTLQIFGTSSPGDPLIVPGQGTWTVNTSTGAITFTPEAGFTGDPTPIQYTVQDNDGNTSAPATVTVDYVQYPPVAVGDTSLANVAGPVTLNVTDNDSDTNGDLLPSTVDLDPATAGQQITLVVSGQGTWAVDGLGNVTFTPQSGFTQDPTPIPYTVSDATGLVSNQATITIDYVPVAMNDSSSSNPTGSPVTVNVLANDTTGDAAVPSTVQIFGTAAPGNPLVVSGEGTWSVNTTTGAITFTPEVGYTGDPTPIQYTVQDNDGNTSAPATVTVDYLQIAPVAVNDGSLHNPGGPVTLSVTSNDSDANSDLRPSTVDLDPATAGQQTTLVVSGEGTWAVDGLGNVTFTPQFGFTEDPTPIPYTVSDATELVSNQATITIDYVPVASDDNVSGNTTGTPVTVNVLNNDTAGDAAVPSTVQIVGTASPGAPLVVPGQGTWSVNTATGAITFTPEAGYTGDPTPIQYTVQDNDGNTSAPATVTLDYNQFPPVAVNDSELHNLPGPVTLKVTANDTDANGDLGVNTVDLDQATAGQQTTLVVSGQGTWAVDGLGNVTFTPESGFTQDPTPIVYTVNDATGLVSNQATITIDYVPVAANDSSSGNSTGTAVTVNVLSNDTAGDTAVPSTVQIFGTASPGDPLAVPGQGTWSVNTATGAITFTPEAGFTGDPTPIQYTVKDNDGNTSTPATVTVDYLQIAPVAVSDSSLHNPAGPVTLSVTGNDSDANGDLRANTVDLDPATAGQQTTLVVGGQGTWAVDGLGNVTFTPQSGFTNDPTPISYTVSDATELVSNPATVTIDYVPVASNDLASGNTTGTPVMVNVLSNDTTGDVVMPSTVQIVGTANQGDPLVVAGEGTWSVNTATGTITFTPEAGFTGDPTPIQYTVQDNDGNTSAPATVTVDYVQHPPVAVDDSDLHNLPGPVTLNVTANDSDANGDLRVNTVDLDPATAGQQTTLTVASEGIWSVDNSGNVTFTPGAGFTHDPTPIPYTVSDATGLVSNQATITVDYVPVATNDSLSGNPTGTAATVFVLANDTTGDTTVPSTVQIFGTSNPGDPLAVPGQGIWSVNTTTGAITFTPEPGFTGDPTSIQYTVKDAQGNTSNAATVTVDYAQYPPAAVNDVSLANLPGPVTLNVTGNDTDANGDLLPSTVDLDLVTPGQQTTLVVSGQGTWAVDGLGNVTFTPQSGFTHDPMPIGYTVSDATGLVSNEATITIDYVPVATNDNASGATGAAVTVPVLTNDTTGDAVVPSTVQIFGTDNPGDPLVVPGQGTWSVNTTTGAITFTPEAGYTGDPTPIQYTVKDNDGNNSAPATVTVDYNQIAPVAVDDSSLANLPGPVTLSVTGNDSDANDDLLPSTVDLDPATAGQQTTLTVSGEGSWAVDGLGNVTFTPVFGFTQDPTPIPYTVSDATGLVSNQATITIDYVPVATNDNAIGTTGAAVTVNVLSNDTTGDTAVPSTVQIFGTSNPGDPLVVPGQGTWSVNATTGAITFTPEAGYTGDPTPIRYTVRDNDGNTSAPATVTIDYNQFPPVAVNDNDLHNPPGPVTLNVTANDTDANGDLRASTVDLDPANAGQQTTLVVSGEGTWAVDGLGNVTFTPQSGFTQDPAPIVYTVSDATGLVSNQATITIDYVPVAANDFAGGTVGTPATVAVLANDTAGDTVVPSTVQIFGTAGPGVPLVVPGQGTWSVNTTTGDITFTPEAGYTGDPTPIRYTVKDNDGNTSAPATVTIDYNQHPPVAIDDSSLANLPGPVTLNVTANDTDPNADLLASTVDLDPATAGQQTTFVVSGQGTWAVDGSGNVTFTPQFGFTQDPTPISYTVSDVTGQVSNQATITIDYVPVATNDTISGNPVGTPVTAPVLANDTTGDAVVPSTVQIVGTANPGASLVVAGEGTWSVNTTTGAITFTPEAGFTGDPTSIQYTVQDNDGNTSAPATITVDYTQHPPLAVNDSDLHNLPGPVTLNVTANDGDPNDDLVVSTVDLDPATSGRQTSLTVTGEGTWTVDDLGNVTFTPVSGFTHDPTSISYVVSDVTGQLSNPATITIDYVPVASADSSSGNATGTPVTVDVLANDNTGDAVVPSTVQIFGTASPGESLVVPGQGTWSVNRSTGEITFTPEAGYTGDPTPIQYTVKDNDGNVSAPATVTVDYLQIAPVANDNSSLANPPGAVTLNVTDNDTDANGDLRANTVDLDPATAGQQTNLTVAGEGAWAVDGLGNVTFTPQFGFTHDPTPIPYTVSDATGLVSNPATITIDYVPVAASDNSTDNPTGTSVTVNVLANDTTGDAAVPATVQIVGTGAPGASLVVPGQGTWSVNTATGAITFTPEAGYTGDPDPINYTVQDAQGNISGTTTVTVDYLQIPPVAVNDNDLHNLPGSVTLNVTANDSDANGDLSVNTVDLDPNTAGRQTSLAVAGEGTWQADDLGNVTFTPESGFTHDPTPITYTVSDATGLVSNEATIAIDYVPVATADSSSSNTTGTPVTVPVLSNDTTGDAVVPATVQIFGTANPGDPLVVSGQGTWSVDTTTGAITFTPEPGYTGDPTPIQYTVRDNDGNTSNPVTVSVDYLQIAPVAVNDSSLHNPAGPVTLNVTGNDSDVNGDLRMSTVDLDPATAGQQTTLTVAGEGRWTVDGLGNVTFTPQSGFTHDPTPIPYTVSDATGLVSNQATITIDYVPVASADLATSNTGVAVTIPVLANDTTGDTVVPSTVQIVGTTNPGDPLVVPGQGTWSVDPTTGAITFTPEPGYTGDPTPIQYTVKDNDGNTSAPATVTVDYAQNLPVAVNDSSPGNLPGPVTLNVTGNDSDTNGDLRPSTVDLDPSTPGRQTTRTVAGEGTWTVDDLGNVTFTPRAGFLLNPTPIKYTVSDATGLTSNQATITISYVPQTDLSVRKTANVTTVAPGGSVVYTITVTNLGPSTVSSLILVDTPSAYLLNRVYTASKGTYNSTTGLWTGLNLAQGQSIVLTLKGTVSTKASGTMTNQVTMSLPDGQPIDPNLANNQASVKITVKTAPVPPVPPKPPVATPVSKRYFITSRR